MLLFYKYFRKNGEKMGVLAKIFIIKLHFEKNASFFAENCDHTQHRPQWHLLHWGQHRLRAQLAENGVI
jgi:hypothetical protein